MKRFGAWSLGLGIRDLHSEGVLLHSIWESNVLPFFPLFYKWENSEDSESMTVILDQSSLNIAIWKYLQWKPMASVKSTSIPLSAVSVKSSE
jgi:hypothetical protein